MLIQTLQSDDIYRQVFPFPGLCDAFDFRRQPPKPSVLLAESGLSVAGTPLGSARDPSGHAVSCLSLMEVLLRCSQLRSWIVQLHHIVFRTRYSAQKRRPDARNCG